MKVSFLVTYYNQREYVSDSIESILRIEKPCDWEILIGDDGSSDGTTDVVNTYIARDPEHIHLFVMDREPNKEYDPVRRVSANRLSLLSKSTGDYFCVLDGDDYFIDTDFLQNAIEAFKDNTVSVVAFGYREEYNGTLGNIVTLPKEMDGKYVPQYQYLRFFYIHAGGCVHRKCWDTDRVNYLKKIGFYDDNSIVINGLNYGEMYAICKPIYAYRQIKESVYTGMDVHEKALLNTLAYDAEKLLIQKKYKRDLFCRCGNSILCLYKNRYDLKRIFPDHIYRRYLAAAGTLPESICYKLLNYRLLSFYEKIDIRNKMIYFVTHKHYYVWRIAKRFKIILRSIRESV